MLNAAISVTYVLSSSMNQPSRCSVKSLQNVTVQTRAIVQSIEKRKVLPLQTQLDAIRVPRKILENQGKNVGKKSPSAEEDKSDYDIKQLGTQHIKGCDLHAKVGGQSVRPPPNEYDTKTDKTTLACGVEEPLDESGTLNMRKGDNAVSNQSSVKTTKSSGVKATASKSSLALTFPQKGNGHSAKSITAGRGMTAKRIKTAPGVAVASGGPNLEKHLMEPESQCTDADETKARSATSTNDNQPEVERNNADKDMLEVNSPTETADGEKTSVNSPLNKDQAGGITHPDKIKKADTPDDGNDDSGDSNAGNVPDSEANASTAGDKETQTSTSYTTTKESTADKATAESFSQVPLEKATNQTDPDSSTAEASSTEGIN